ncbi:hypothetical protein BH09SUM1_BH09SUM1_18550 [soil metagenome]
MSNQRDRFEELLNLEIDGELSAAGREELAALLRIHPDWEEEANQERELVRLLHVAGEVKAPADLAIRVLTRELGARVVELEEIRRKPIARKWIPVAVAASLFIAAGTGLYVNRTSYEDHPAAGVMSEDGMSRTRQIGAPEDASTFKNRDFTGSADKEAKLLPARSKLGLAAADEAHAPEPAAPASEFFGGTDAGAMNGEKASASAEKKAVEDLSKQTAVDRLSEADRKAPGSPASARVAGAETTAAKPSATPSGSAGAYAPADQTVSKGDLYRRKDEFKSVMEAETPQPVLAPQFATNRDDVAGVSAVATRKLDAVDKDGLDASATKGGAIPSREELLSAIAANSGAVLADTPSEDTAQAVLNNRPAESQLKNKKEEPAGNRRYMVIETDTPAQAQKLQAGALQSSDFDTSQALFSQLLSNRVQLSYQMQGTAVGSSASNAAPQNEALYDALTLDDRQATSTANQASNVGQQSIAGEIGGGGSRPDTQQLLAATFARHGGKLAFIAPNRDDAISTAKREAGKTRAKADAAPRYLIYRFTDRRAAVTAFRELQSMPQSSAPEVDFANIELLATGAEPRIIVPMK